MEFEFDVKMTTSTLYDYALNHAYKGASGILGTAVGVLLLANFVRYHQFLYLLFGLVTVFYIPVALYISAKRQVLSVPAFKEPLHYRITEEGMEVSQGEEKAEQKWDAVLSAVSTRKSIILYTGKAVATIFPREDMGKQTENVIKMISTHVDPKRVKIRY